MTVLFKPDFLTIPLILIEDKYLQSLDRLVYGVIYWATRLKNEKCTMSNTTIADCLGASQSGVANALVRLNDKHYIKTIYKDEKKKERLEIIPLVFFVHAGVYSTEETGFTQTSKQVYSIEEQNKNINKKSAVKKQADLINTQDYLLTIPLEDVLIFQKDYQLTPQKIRSEAQYAHTWLGSKEITYKNYRKFLQNWLRRTIERTQKPEQMSTGYISYDDAKKRL